MRFPEWPGRVRDLFKAGRRKSRIRLVWILVVTLLGVFWSIPVSRENDGGQEAEILVVLGGNTRERSRACHALWLRRPGRVLVTGDDGHIVRELLRLGIPADQILHEPSAVNTRQNAEFSVRLLRASGYRSALLVTSWFHTSRSHACFVTAAPEMRFATFSEPAPSRWSADDWKLVILEKCKKSAYAVRWGINPWNAGDS
jgi:uncharacterized SAM-binding protein YcdF (DUF218 family)